MAKDFMKMIMPSHAKNVKLYADPQPLFARYQVETYLGAMFNPTVQLPSGGYIVIGVTEALVAIDVNSGRATKEGSIEQTALKTNLEASDEVARQLRLRDLAGLIVIDYIDMDERKNNTAVEKRFKDKLKTDRARIQVGRISAFGLLEMSRQRLRPGMIEATTQPCSHCHGTGLLRSDDSLSLAILRQLEEEGVRRRSREVLVKAPVAFANYLMNQKREHVAQIEVRYGMAVRIEGDPALVSPDFSVEKFKTATRNVKAVSAAVVSVDASLMDDFDDAVDLVADEASAAPGAPDEPSAEEGQPKKRRRRRRRGRGRGNSGENRDGDASGNDNRDSNARQQAGDAAQSADGDAKPAEAAEGAEGGDAPADEAPKKRTATRSRSRAAKPKANGAAAADVTQGDGDIAVAAPSEAPAAETPEAEAPAPEADVAEKPKRKTRSRAKKAAEPEVTADAADAAATEQAAEVAAAPVAKVAADDSKPKRKGWWSLGR